MKACLLLLLLFAGIPSLYAQTDSAEIYSREARLIRRAYMDSMRNDPRLKYIQQYVYSRRARSDRYFAITLFTQLHSASFGQLNADHQPLGFSRLSGTAPVIGYGFSWKDRRNQFDFQFAGFGLARKMERGDETIRTSMGTLLQLEYGFDLIRSRRMDVYPYAGLGLRSTELKYSGPLQTNPSATNLTDVVATSASVEDGTARIGYQAGIALDLVLSRIDRAGGVILALKFGTNRPFKRERYDFHGFRYDPDLRFGEWALTAGFKFFGR